MYLLDVCIPYLGSPGLPSNLAHVIYLVYKAIQLFIPILLIIWGMLDLGKAVMAQKEDEIKKGQQTFIKRVIAAAICFFIVSIVKLVVNLFSGNATTMISCINAILDCNSNSCVDPTA